MIDRGRLGADYGVVRLRNGGAASSSSPTFGSLREAAEAGYHGKSVNIEGKGVQKVSFADSSYDRSMAQKSAAASGGSGSNASSGARNVVSSAANTGRGFIEAVKSIPSGIVRDVSMGFSANPFANRDAQRENLAERGYSQAEIDDYFARTDATMARMAAENAGRGIDRSEVVAPAASQALSAEELARAFAEGKDLTGQTQQSLQPMIMEYLRGRGVTNFAEYLPKIFETLQLPAAPPVMPVIGTVGQQPVQPPTPEPPVQPPITQYPAFTPIQPVGAAGAFMPSPMPSAPQFGMAQGQQGALPPPMFGLPPLGQQDDPFGLRQGFV